jgi:hypothetical protein
LTSSTGTQGYYYVVNVAGTTNLDGITDWQVGDWAIYNGTVWQKVDNTDAVSSVNGQTGTVVLTTTDIGEGTNEYFTTAKARASVSAGTGISYDNSTGVITNSAPDQTVAISEGTGIDVTGTYPNFTVTNTAPDQTVAISAGTGISTSGTYPNFTVTNTAPDQTVALTGAGTTVVTGTYPNFTITSTDSTTGTVTSVAATAGTGISVSGSPITTSGTLTITNTAPDQVVSLTQGGTTTITGTYPNFTISSDDQYDGTVTSVGGTGTVNGLTLTGTVTTSGNITLGGALDLSAPPVIGGTTPNTITGTTINANTKVVSPDYYAQSILGGNLRTSGGTSLLNWDGGGSGVITVNGGLSANPANKNISLAPTGTGSVTVNPAAAGTIDNMAIGGTTAAAGSFTNLSVTGTASFDGSQGTSGQVLTSAGSGNTPTWTTPTTGTVTSVSGTAPIASSGGDTPAISISQATTSTDGYLSSTDWNTFNGKASPVTYTSTYVPYGQGTTTPDQSADFTYDESVKTVTAPQVRASNGIIVNSATVSADYSIPSGSNAMSAGPITVASGITVTVPSGNAWIIV